MDYINNIAVKRELIEKIRRMSYEELYNLANEIRNYMISVVSENGGHLASNLGTVELTIALYRVFDPFKDYIIWDTGHQTYTHKLLTGRWEKFKTLRKYGGLSGFTNIFEDNVDRFGAGHVGTAIAAALGIDKALRLEGRKENVIVIIGDGALTSGQALEALNQVKSQNSKIKIILNSNGMSISKNVGSLSLLLEALRTNKIYLSFKERFKKSLSHLAEMEIKKIREALKVAIAGEDFFEALGLKHFGPIDGHDLKDLEDGLRQIKDYPYPTVLTVFTVKGKGYMHSENNPTKFHGVEKFDPDSGIAEKPEGAISYSEVFGNILTKLAHEDQKIVALTAAMAEGTGLSTFSKEHPERFVDLGITEQSVVTYAGGLATLGYKPVVAIYSTFLQRAYDQIIHDIALQNLNVLFAIDRAGLVGTDGPTHHGVFDISYLRLIPNIKIITPLDSQDLANVLYTILKNRENYNGPIAIRYPRDIEFAKLDKICDKIEKVEPFKWFILNTGKNVAILSVGTITKEYIKMSRENNYTLVGVRSVKPFDEEVLVDVFKKHELIITVEEGSIIGGFGEGINTYYMRNLKEEFPNIKIRNIGIPDDFVPHGNRTELLKLVGLDEYSILKAIREIIENQN